MPQRFSSYRFSQEVQRQRLLHNLTQEDLAGELHCTVRCVQKWESGESLPRIDTFCELVQVFSVTADDLLGLQDQSHLTANPEAEK